jgi:hypothetical protein
LDFVVISHGPATHAFFLFVDWLYLYSIILKYYARMHHGIF